MANVWIASGKRVEAANVYSDSPERSLKKTKKNQKIGQQTTTRPAARLTGLTPDDSRPYAARYGNEASLSSLRSFERQCGIGSHDYAVRCLALAQRFNQRPWLQQVRQAVAMATVGVKRVYEHQPHLLAEEDAGSGAGRWNTERILCEVFSALADYAAFVVSTLIGSRAANFKRPFCPQH